jgi:hypothetical protein
VQRALYSSVRILYKVQYAMPFSCSHPSLVVIAHDISPFELQQGKEHVQPAEQEGIVACVV